MKKTSFKFSCLLSMTLLAAVLTASCLFAACSGNASGGGANTDAETQSGEIGGAADDSASKDSASKDARLNVPRDKNYGGYVFAMNGYDHTSYIGEHKADELTGDLLNDAIYERNREAEELFGVKINVVIGVWGNDECRRLITTSVMAGDNSFDLFTGNTYNMTFLSAQGMFKRITDVPYIDHDAPWWNQSIYKEYSVGKNAYLMTGDIALSYFGQLEAVFFNKKLIKDYKFDDPYKLVYDDKWTCDKLIAMTKDFYVDLNGNGAADEEGDIYGFYGSKSSVYGIANHWTPVTTKNKDNYPEITFYSERTAEMFVKLKDYFINSPGALCPEGWTDYELWITGVSVFSINTMVRVTYFNLRSSEIDYGFVPIPKYDENQKDYRTYAAGLVVAAPVTAEDFARTGMVTETLAYYGRQIAYPAFIDNAITEKGTRDEDSKKMLELIAASPYCNFGVAFSGFQGYGYALLEFFKTDKGFSSYYESMTNAAAAELINYADMILALEQ